MSKMGARILVVDDEIEILRALQRSLTAHGFEVFTAGSGEEALEALFIIGQTSCCSTWAYQALAAWKYVEECELSRIYRSLYCLSRMRSATRSRRLTWGPMTMFPNHLELMKSWHVYV